MKFINSFSYFIFALLLGFNVNAQENIPIGTWRTHFSYNQVNLVLEKEQEIYAVSEKGLFVFDKEDNSITKISKIDGLQESNISSIQYDPQSELVFIGYASGNLDIIDGVIIENLDLTTNSQIQGSKQINHISIHQNYAYISTDFGVLKFDIEKREVKETYRELGLSNNDTPQALQVKMSAVLNDSLFIATAQGVLAANLVENINLLDYRNWYRFDLSNGIPDDEVEVITNRKGVLVAGINDEGLFTYQNGGWVDTGSLSASQFNAISTNNENTFVVADSIVYQINSDFSVTEVLVSGFEDVGFSYAIQDDAGSMWLASLNSGLVSNFDGSYQSYLPSGPLSNEVFRLNYIDQKIYGLAGGFGGNVIPFNNQGQFYAFSKGTWSSTVFNEEEFDDITDVVSFNGKLYLASAGYGLLEIDSDGGQIIYDETNSPLINIAPPGRNTRVPAIVITIDGLWVLNYGVGIVHLLDSEGNWQSFGINTSIAAFANDVISAGDDLWLIIDQVNGGGIAAFDPETEESRYLTSASGNGGLSSTNVNTLAYDKDGFVWVGSDLGISVFSNPSSVFSGTVDAVEPIFENRQLLRDETVTDIEIDGGNRKWIGTERGVWLFDQQADRQIRFFDSGNSPLPSSKIVDIEINDKTGEVFFATSEGLVSWRGTGTEGEVEHTNVKIFPNPVRENFQGVVGISGLANNANVKITDASGKLIWQTQANGSTATWQVQDYNGSRAATGVYLVFSSSQDGEETFVGKIAVIK